MKLLRTLALTAFLPLASAVLAQPAPAPRPPGVLTPGVLALQAIYSGTNRPVSREVAWRVYSIRGGETTEVARSTDAAPNFALPPGEYMVHVSQGLAAATRRVVMTSAPLVERLNLNAGGLVLKAKLAEAPVPAERQAISVFIPAPNDSEGRLVTDKLRAGELLRLPEGAYHIVSTYAGSNSVVRADITVQSGRVTEATMNHRAATMTLKLVRHVGGTALANTTWTVQTPGGDVIKEAIGAFPTLELAEGEYDVIARNEGREFKDKMKVVSGVNRDHEVVMR